MMSAMNTEGYIVPFILDNGMVRGRLVRLGTALSDITDTHKYPDIINHYMAEMLSLGAALIMDMKTAGLITLQITNATIIRMLIADVNSDGDIRACASWDEEALTNLINDTPKPSFAQLFAGGNLTFTVGLVHQREQYQAIVELNGATLSDCMHHYFRQSAQIPTALFIGVKDAVDTSLVSSCSDVDITSSSVVSIHPGAYPVINTDYRAGAILLQRTPVDSSKEQSDIEKEEDDWFTDVSLLATIKLHELLSGNLAPDQLLHRLFHERNLQITTFKGIQARCTCSRERIEEILESFTGDDLADMLVDDKIDVDCEFCSAKYIFDRSIIDALIQKKRER